MKFVYLIGGPATGKTTVLEALTKTWGPPAWEDFPVKHLHWGGERIQLGHPKVDGFGGTDTWGYAEGQKGVNWLLTQPAPLVVGEGDRLAVEGWLRTLGGVVVWCHCDRHVLESRRKFRTQDARWVKGRDTKVLRLAEALKARVLDTGRPLERVVAELRAIAELP